MQLLTTRVRLAVAAVCEIADRPMTSLASTHALADRFGVCRRYFEVPLQALRRAGLLEGVRGPSGGYRLARPAAEISVLDILRALEPAETDTLPAALGYACAKFLADLDKISVADLRERDPARLDLVA